MVVNIQTYRSFSYFVYQPNNKLFPEWFEFYVERMVDEVNSCDYDSLMRRYNGVVKQNKERADAAAKKLIDLYHAGDKRIKAMFDLPNE